MPISSLMLVAALVGAPSSTLGAVPVSSPQATGVAAAQSERLVGEVRVHGNHTTPDSEVLRLAGVSVGQPLAADTADAVARRLRSTGRFEAVEVRTRSRSLDAAGPVTLIIIVREHAVPDAVLESTPQPLRPIKRLMASGMFLPILNYTDGYGLTYGARVSFVDVLGRGGRVSVPLSWGGTKRAAVEVERTIRRAPFDRLFGGAAISRRKNPAYERDEDRKELWAGATKSIARVVRLGIHAGTADVTFGGVEDRVNTYGTDVTIDTRNDPVFPRNAVYLSGGWERFDPRESARANRYRAEARGYLGLVRQSVLSVRWQYSWADQPLPLYAKPLLGGADSLRGYRAGRFVGDSMMAVATELRLPLNSPMGVGKSGLTLFTDVGATWDHGTKLDAAEWHRGAGVGWFLLASVFQFNAEVGVREGGGVRLHVRTGMQF
jgi:hypothetical protein